MPETHINAYFADVAEKEKAVLQAHAELEEARLRLKEKQQEIGWTDEPSVPDNPESEFESDNDGSDDDRRNKKKRH